MPTPIDWKSINAVFLDMDGTLLDLYFDNYFWHEFVPLRFSEMRNIELHDAKQQLQKCYKSKAGTLDWYCVDYWTDELGLDIPALKREISKRIQIFPNVEKFLSRLRHHGKHISLVTNAHRKTVEIKMDCSGIGDYFDRVICSHDYGYPKEEQPFWHRFMQAEPFDPAATLFIDDNLAVLAAAEAYGIQHLISIKQPDSSKPLQDTQHYRALADFEEIMPA